MCDIKHQITITEIGLERDVEKKRKFYIFVTLMAAFLQLLNKGLIFVLALTNYVASPVLSKVLFIMVTYLLSDYSS